MANLARTFEPQEMLTHPERFFRRVYVWELPVRITHWVNAVCITVLFLTGLYIATPIFSSSGEPANHFLMGRIRQVHFAAGMIFAVSFLLRTYWFFRGNRYSRSGFPLFWRPSWWREFFGEALEYLKLQPGRPSLGYNALQGSAYTLMFVLGGFEICTGLALYSETNPGGLLDHLFGWVIPLLGGSFQTRMYHHLVAWAFPILAVVHIYIVSYLTVVSGTGLVSSIFGGFKFYRRDEAENDK